jgi:transcriptional regulator with XRE-family HTH domain
MPPRIHPSRPPRQFVALWREKVGLTQEQLGGRLGVTDVTVSRWETGKRVMDLNTLQALAEALGVNSADLQRHPDAPSVDELLRGQPEEVWNQVVTIAKTIRR